jgi:hypothetical protein
MTRAVELAQVAAAGVSEAFKNRIINGAMVIDQRNAGASVTQTTSSLYPVDRFAIYGSVTSKFTGQQSSTAPTGFNNSLLLTSSSAYTVGSAETYFLDQRIEGFNTADLGFGTANAKTVTLSFWVRSSLTGTFGGSLMNSAYNRSYPFSYTITSANTWEQKSITIAGDTTGTWTGATNGTGLRVHWSLGTGSTYSGTAGSWAAGEYYSATGATSVVGTNGATFYLTGCQLEVGTTATNFDFRSYGTELSLCQRYFYLHASGTMRSGSVYTAIMNSAQWSTTSFYGYIQFPTTMRSTPTVYQNTGTAYYILYAGGATQNVSSFGFQDGGTTSIIIYGANAGSVTVGTAGWAETSNASALLGFNAEL